MRNRKRVSLLGFLTLIVLSACNTNPPDRRADFAPDATLLQQSRDWVTLRREFGGATIRFRAAVAHPNGQMPIQEFGHSNAATITLGGDDDVQPVVGLLLAEPGAEHEAVL
jgi:hypothetical protein